MLRRIVVLMLALGLAPSWAVQADLDSASAINKAGRQRMLTQRLTLLYMAGTAGADSPLLRGTRDAAAAEFAAGLEQLRQAAPNTPALRRQLESVALQWEWFRSVLELRGEDSYGELVASASESILSSLERITGQYESLFRG